MTLLFAFLFAHSLLGDLSAGATRPSEPVEGPYAPSNVEANAAVAAEAQPVAVDAPASSEEDPVAEPVAETSAEAEAVGEEPVVADEAAAENPAVEEPKQDEPVAEETEQAEPPAEVQKPAEEPPQEDKAAEDVPKAKAKSSHDRPEFEMPRSVKITSERTDYDRREGVIMFDKNVFVDDAEYKMHSDQLYVFLDGTNELKRIVAIGNVSITNETRVGSCAKAAYTKSVGKVVMYGDSSGARAKLADYGKRKSEVEGRKITFWIDSEQVEVEGSTVTLDAGGYGGKEGAKKLLGK